MLNKKTLLITFLVIQAMAIIGFLQGKHFDYLYETLIITAGVLLLNYVENKKRIFISNYLRSVVYLAVSGHTIGGELLNLYSVSTIYDKYLHIFGTYSFALLGYVLLGLPNFPLWPKVKFVLVITIGLAIGAFYELVEFATDQFLHPVLPAQSGLVDTNLDMIADLLGSILAALHLAFFKI